MVSCFEKSSASLTSYSCYWPFVKKPYEKPEITLLAYGITINNIANIFVNESFQPPVALDTY